MSARRKPDQTACSHPVRRGAGAAAHLDIKTLHDANAKRFPKALAELAK